MIRKILLFLFILFYNGVYTQNSANDFLIGACLSSFDLNNVKEDLFLKDFRYLTLPNESKQNVIHPRPNIWRWHRPDELVSFAEKHNILVRLHGPISPQCSKWVKDDNRTIEELENNLTEFLTASCIRYNDSPNVVWMDVVNETILTNGEWFGPRPGNDKWENPWLQLGIDQMVILTILLKLLKLHQNLQLIKNLYLIRMGGCRMRCGTR